MNRVRNSRWPSRVRTLNAEGNKAVIVIGKQLWRFIRY
jgi:hypothetical protein